MMAGNPRRRAKMVSWLSGAGMGSGCRCLLSHHRADGAAAGWMGPVAGERGAADESAVAGAGAGVAATVVAAVVVAAFVT